MQGLAALTLAWLLQDYPVHQQGAPRTWRAREPGLPGQTCGLRGRGNLVHPRVAFLWFSRTVGYSPGSLRPNAAAARLPLSRAGGARASSHSAPRRIRPPCTPAWAPLTARESWGPFLGGSGLRFTVRCLFSLDFSPPSGESPLE